MVVITGYPSAETAAKTRQLGALEYLAKPFTPDELIGGVDRALGASVEAGKLTALAVKNAIAAVSGSPVVKPSRSGATVVAVDLNACMACLSCEVECGAAHLVGTTEGSRGLSGVAVGKMLEHARFHVETVGTHCVPVRCRQCEDPTCVRACPTGAIAKLGPGGAVVIDDRKCIGCRNCLLACPFGSIYVNGETNMVVKCDQCAGIVNEGEDPVCVRSCPQGALKCVPVNAAVEDTREAAAREVADTYSRQPRARKENE
jgi:anaerobic dimethyl sulfoxide reductase subunit B (iron-sulfur subunit)